MTPLLVTMGGAREHFWQPCGGILASKVHSLGPKGLPSDPLEHNFAANTGICVPQ